MYQLIFTDKAVKYLKTISKKDIIRILEALETLAEHPEVKSNVKRLRNHPIAVYRLKVGNYRVLFDKKEILRIIEIIDIGHRKNIYQ